MAYGLSFGLRALSLARWAFAVAALAALLLRADFTNSKRHSRVFSRVKTGGGRDELCTQLNFHALFQGLFAD